MYYSEKSILEYKHIKESVIESECVNIISVVIYLANN